MGFEGGEKKHLSFCFSFFFFFKSFKNALVYLLHLKRYVGKCLIIPEHTENPFELLTELFISILDREHVPFVQFLLFVTAFYDILKIMFIPARD